MFKTTKLYSLILHWVTFTFIRGHSCIKNKKNFGVYFLANLSIDLDEIRYVATTRWFVEAHAKFIVHK